MKKTFKRVLAILLAIFVIATLMPQQVYAKKKTQTYYNWTKQKNYEYIDGQWIIRNEDSYSYKKNGDTKSYTYRWYDYDNETKVNTKGPLNKSVYSYGKNKHTTKNYVDGKYTGKTVYTSSSKKSTSKEYDAKGKLLSSDVTTFDKKGNPIKSVYKRGKDKSVTKYKNTYKKGRLVKVVTTYPNNTKSTTTYSYHSNGAWKKVTYKSKWSTSTDTYDKKYRLIKNVEDDDYSKRVTTYEYKGKSYDAKKKTEKITFKEDNRTETNIYTFKRKYDKNKNLTEEIQYKNGEEEQKSVYSGYKKFKYTYEVDE